VDIDIVELTDGDIVVRPYRAEDIPLVYESARESLPGISRWMPWCHPNYSVEETKIFVLSRPERWQSDAEYGFGIFRPSGRHLGGVGVNFINRIHQMANLGYWVRSSETGQGIASRAAG
jgi:RimJ/RimL family protein N-acetyltransferase